MKKRFLLIAVALIVITGFAWAAGRRQADDGRIRVIFIAMDSVDEHWLTVRAGTEAKAQQLGNIDLSFNAPPDKLDALIQLQMVEDAITRRMHAILLAPLDRDAINPAVDRARAAGIPVVIVDSAVSTAHDAFLATDNEAAARMAADTLAQLIGGQGQVAIINHQPGAGTAIARENPFRDQMATRWPGITIVGTQFSDGDRARALNIATDFMTAHPNLAAIYATNEGSTVGAGIAIEQAGRAGQVRFVGFDWSEDTRDLVQRGVLDATMVQNPFQMGYLGVQVAVDLVTGRALANRNIDTGVSIITRENMHLLD